MEHFYFIVGAILIFGYAVCSLPSPKPAKKVKKRQ